jgi:hypothetical protein
MCAHRWEILGEYSEKHRSDSHGKKNGKPRLHKIENPVDRTIRRFSFFLPHGFSFFQEGYLGPFGSLGYRLVPRTWMTCHPSLSAYQSGGRRGYSTQSRVSTNPGRGSPQRSEILDPHGSYIDSLGWS